MIRTEEIAAGRVDGHITHAEHPRGGVLILPTITAVDAHMRTAPGLLAEAGFTAMIWNPYPGEAPPADMAAAQARAGKLNDGVIDAMADCVSHHARQAAFAGGGGAGLLPRRSLRGAARGASDKRLWPACRIIRRSACRCRPTRRSTRLRWPRTSRARSIWSTAPAIRCSCIRCFCRSVTCWNSARPQRWSQVHPGAVHSFMRPDLQTTPANALGEPAVLAAGDGVPGDLPARGRGWTRQIPGLIFAASALISRSP